MSRLVFTLLTFSQIASAKTPWLSIEIHRELVPSGSDQMVFAKCDTKDTRVCSIGLKRNGVTVKERELSSERLSASLESLMGDKAVNTRISEDRPIQWKIEREGKSEETNISVARGLEAYLLTTIRLY